MRRERIWSCAHPDTYKYYLALEEVLAVWNRLAQHYGRPQELSSFGVVEIRTDAVWIRSTRMLNPVTLVRLRSCSLEDVQEFHRIVGYDPAEVMAG